MTKRNHTWPRDKLTKGEEIAAQAISEIFLDTELEDSDFKYIARQLIESGLSLSEIFSLYKYDVALLLDSNLKSIAGIWSGFNEEWLINALNEERQKRNTSCIAGFFYKILVPLRMKDSLNDWERVQKEFQLLINENQ